MGPIRWLGHHQIHLLTNCKETTHTFKDYIYIKTLITWKNVFLKFPNNVIVHYDCRPWLKYKFSGIKKVNSENVTFQFHSIPNSSHSPGVHPVLLLAPADWSGLGLLAEHAENFCTLDPWKKEATFFKHKKQYILLLKTEVLFHNLWDTWYK